MKIKRNNNKKFLNYYLFNILIIIYKYFLKFISFIRLPL